MTKHNSPAKTNFQPNQSRSLQHTRISVQSIMDHTPLGICVTDENGYFESVNNAYCNIYEYKEDELLGKHFTLVVPEEYKDRLAKMHDDFIVMGLEIRGEWEVVTRTGKRKTILADAAKILNDEGEAKKVTFVMDITREKEFQLELEQKNQELEKLNASKDRFLGMAAHDLRSPLGGIKSFSDLLLEDMAGPLNDEQRDYLRLISDSSTKLLKLVNDLLDLNSIARGRLEIDFQPVNLKQLIQQNIRKQELMARKKNISIQSELEELSEIKVDPDRINQVLDNLLSNAIKFTPPEKTIRVVLSAKDNSAFIRVKDDGPGISAEEQNQLFSEFHKGKARPTGGECSTGLGLAIVKRIVEAHDGAIEISSTPGQGAEFKVELPY